MGWRLISIVAMSICYVGHKSMLQSVMFDNDGASESKTSLFLAHSSQTQSQHDMFQTHCFWSFMPSMPSISLGPNCPVARRIGSHGATSIRISTTFTDSFRQETSLIPITVTNSTPPVISCTSENGSDKTDSCNRSPRYLLPAPIMGLWASRVRHDSCPQSTMIRGGVVTGPGRQPAIADRGSVHL